MILKDLLESNIQEFGEYPLLHDGTRSFTNIETRDYADKLSVGLYQLGIEKGDRVIVCLPNCSEVIFSYQGITRAGGIIVPVMFMLHSKEIHYIALNSGAKVIITSTQVMDKIEEAVIGLPSKPIIITVDVETNERAYNFYDILKNGTVPSANMDLSHNETAVILYTSGTTGNPKGVLLTHKNLYSNALNSAKHNETTQGTTLGVLPLAHVYGLTTSNICFITGSTVVIFSKFDPLRVFEAIEKFQVKSFSAVPAMIHAMLAFYETSQYDISSLEWITSGSAPLPIALIFEFEKKFGAKIYEGYGLSEAAPVVTAHRRGIAVKPGSVGQPIPGVEIKIVNEKGQELPIGEVGELIVRGDSITPGYYQNKLESEKTIRNGWLYTGDMARKDHDGYIYIVDRKKDLIIRGGFNLYPRDVEELLNSHECVHEVAVVGIPDERMGEEMIACIVKKPHTNITEAELIQYCQEHLAKNKTPRKILFFDTLPRNGVGKILKTHLRKTAADIISLS